MFDLGPGSKREREERASDERSRCVDRRQRSGSVRATGYKQPQRLPPFGQPLTRFRCRLNRRHSEADRGRPGDRSSVVAECILTFAPEERLDWNLGELVAPDRSRITGMTGQTA